MIRGALSANSMQRTALRAAPWCWASCGREYVEMLRWALIIAVSVFPVAASRADYVMPPFPAVVAESTAIVDATVLELQEHGRVRIVVHEVLQGSRKPPLVLSSAWLTCLGVDLSRMLKVGERYILMLHDGGLYEEGTFYEVRKGTAGLECNCWDGSEELLRRWMSVAEFKQLIEETRGADEVGR